jgi:hypothetical protein
MSGVWVRISDYWAVVSILGRGMLEFGKIAARVSLLALLVLVHLVTLWVVVVLLLAGTLWK